MRANNAPAWFEVDKEGLAKVLERRGKGFVLAELLSNAWDEQVTQVDVQLRRTAPGSRNVTITVTDNSPAGFADLSHSWRLWAESGKKGVAAVRGRYNLGEKLVLALCESARISSTSGTVLFDARGRRISRQRRQAGSEVTCVLRMTEEERAECDRLASLLLPPAGIVTRYNGAVLPIRPALAQCEGVLPTEMADAEGRLRRTPRRTTVTVHAPLDSETPFLYELGVPVVESGLPWHVNVAQKVPLPLDRDNVPPAYLARLRALVLELMHASLEVEQANQSWVRDAIEHHGHELSAGAIGAVVGLRFGDKRVSYDVSDPEANARAVAAGYAVVHGSQLSAAEWEAVRRCEAILPAGRVTPTPKPYSEDGRPLSMVPEAQWTQDMHAVAQLARRLAQEALSAEISVAIAREPQWPFAGTYAPGRLVLNLGRLGHGWFSGPVPRIVSLLVHELAHHVEANHLSERYHRELTRLAGVVTQLALDDPALFAHWTRAHHQLRAVAPA